MQKTIFNLIIIGLILFFTKPVLADKVAGTSALISYNMSTVRQKERDLFIKKLAIKRVLEKYGSPLSESTDAYMGACIQYELDCYLLPSIAGLESTFGKFIYPNSYNPVGWGGGYIMFKSWSEGINAVAKGLRKNYINRGATSLEQIGRIYSESPTWAVRVNYFINAFNIEEQKIGLLLNEKQVQL